MAKSHEEARQCPEGEPSPWSYVTYRFVPEHDVFEIAAWPKGGSIDPSAVQNLLGRRETIREAAMYAYLRAVELGIPQVVDLTALNLMPRDDEGGAA